METFWKDFRYSLRMLRNRPVFTAITSLSLALGIGANSAIFSVVNAVLMRPLPYREPERLVMIWENHFKSGRDRARVAPDNFLEWRKNNRVFEDIAAVVALDQKTLSGAGEPEQVQFHQVSSNFFPLLGVQAALGRVFSEKEDMPHVVGEKEQPHGDRVIILSHGIWQRRFGGDPGVIGKTVHLDREGHTVIGVLPRGFKFIDRQADVWAPLGLDPVKGYFAAGFGRFILAPARLKAGATVEQAREEMSLITGQLQRRIPDLNAGWGANVVPFDKQVVGDIHRALLVLLGAVGFVLLISCANVANLLLAQAAAREKEIAIRASLGASRLRLIRLLLTENLVMAVMGGALGLFLAFWLVKLLIALGPANIPRLSELEAMPLDVVALGFTLAVSLLAGLVSGLAPAWHASKLDLNETLKEGAKSATSGARGARLRSLFVIAEMALALVLLVGAGLMIRSFLRLQATDPGFNPKNLLTMRLLLPSPAYGETNLRTRFFEHVIKRLAALPGVQSASVVSMAPLDGAPGLTSWGMPFWVEGVHARDEVNKPRAEVRLVNSNYFRTMGIPLRMGRDFTEREITEADARVAIINETMARHYWANGNPVGRRIKLNRPENQPDEIIGVVGDVKISDLDAEVAPTIYWPHHSWAFAFGAVLVRTTVDPVSLNAAVTREVHALDPELAIADVRTMEQSLHRSVAQPRFNTSLGAALAAFALALAVVGIYGVMSYAVSQRAREIGIRMALGARPSDVLGLVVGYGMRLTLVGVGVGLAASYALTRALSGWLGWLYEVRPTDPATFIGVSLLLSAVALLACYIPARRATKLDPIETLRHE